MALHEFNYGKDKVVDIVKKILEDSIMIYASDIHFDPSEDNLTIKFRIDGDLIEYTTVPKKIMKNILTRIKILSGMNITESAVPQKGIINYKIQGKAYKMRVSSMPVLHGEKVVVHISNHSAILTNIDELNFSESDLGKIKNLLNNPSGTILLAGATASGMATTLYSMINEIDHKKKSIITIEDNVKIEIEGVNQVQIDRKKGLTPTKIIRNALLTDPNVIVLSQINDIETVDCLLKASATGKLVISTIHSKNVYTTIDTLINMDIEDYLLASSLSGIVSQRLVKKLCPKCRHLRKATDLEKQIFNKVLNQSIKEVYEPVGCDNCINGYQGQLPISEVLELNDTIKNAMTNPNEKNKIRSLVYENTSNIFQDGLRKAILGETSIDEVVKILDLNSDFDENDEDIKKLVLDQLKKNASDDDKEINSDVDINNLIAEKLPIDDLEIENIEVANIELDHIDDMIDEDDEEVVEEIKKEENTDKEPEVKEEDKKDENVETSNTEATDDSKEDTKTQEINDENKTDNVDDSEKKDEVSEDKEKDVSSEKEEVKETAEDKSNEKVSKKKDKKEDKTKENETSDKEKNEDISPDKDEKVNEEKADDNKEASEEVSNDDTDVKAEEENKESQDDSNSKEEPQNSEDVKEEVKESEATDENEKAEGTDEVENTTENEEATEDKESSKEDATDNESNDDVKETAAAEDNSSEEEEQETSNEKTEEEKEKTQEDDNSVKEETESNEDVKEDEVKESEETDENEKSEETDEEENTTNNEETTEDKESSEEDDSDSESNDDVKETATVEDTTSEEETKEEQTEEENEEPKDEGLIVKQTSKKIKDDDDSDIDDEDIENEDQDQPLIQKKTPNSEEKENTEDEEENIPVQDEVSLENKSKDIANAGLSMDQEAIDKIKSTINYDDFSYDDAEDF